MGVDADSAGGTRSSSFISTSQRRLARREPGAVARPGRCACRPPSSARRRRRSAPRWPSCGRRRAALPAPRGCAAPRRRAARPAGGRSRCRFFALVRNRPIVLMCSASAVDAEREHLRGVFATGNRRRVALLTPTSVACADSSTAASSSNTLRVLELGGRVRVGRAQRREERLRRPPASWPLGRARARARASAASITARLRSSACGSVIALAAGRSASLACALSASRSSFSLLVALARAAGGRRSARALRRPARSLQASQPLRAGRDLHHRDAVDRAHRHAQLAAGAQRVDHGVHALGRADDAVDRAGLDAQRAADAPGLVDHRQPARALDAVARG